MSRVLKMEPANRLKNLPQQLFHGLMSQVDELRAAGRDVINLGQGNPDKPTPTHVVEALKQAAENPRFHRYVPFRGLPELKQAVAHWYQNAYGVTLDPLREVAILIGSKAGLEEISLALLNPGDLVMAPDPGYPDYLSGIALAGAHLHPWILAPDLDFLPDPGAWPEKARLAFLNYPNNPTGKLAPEAFFDEVIRKASRNGTVLAHDLAYGDIVFDGKRAVSLLARPGGIEAGVEFTTLSKSFNMAGWRLGFAAGNAEVISYLELLQDHLQCSQFGAIQEAGRIALEGPQESVHAMAHLYQERRDLFLGAARDEGYTIPGSEGSVFLWCPVPASFTAMEWSERFLYQAGVMVAPGTGFGIHGEGFVRISLTEPSERLEEAARRMARLVAGKTPSAGECGRLS